MEYAGFWRRFAACLVDVLILALPTAAINLMFDGWQQQTVNIIVGWLYGAGFESSALMGTPGKRALGISVCTEYGDRLSFLNATWRHAAKYLSGFLLCIGYLMIAFTKRKQGLHDKLAFTYVKQLDPATSESHGVSDWSAAQMAR